MAHGTWEQIKKEIDETLKLTKSLPGFIFAIGNHIPPNIPDETCEYFITYLRKNWYKEVYSS